MTRGDVYRLRAAGQRGREQKGVRYGVLLQADALLPFSTAIVAPTSRSAAPATFRPEIELDRGRTRVLVEQLRTVDVRALGEFAGRLSPQEQGEVDEALALVLDLR
ncbi:MAG: mRNA interferase MazF [Solirubrobacteraceae bacterium]|nr:mRNA interferase MazF [Solirubrobacteraceae bacterium]